MATHVVSRPIRSGILYGSLIGALAGIVVVLVSGGRLPALPILSLAIVGGSVGALVGLGRRT